MCAEALASDDPGERVFHEGQSILVCFDCACYMGVV
jgi:hypothetical protein